MVCDVRKRREAVLDELLAGEASTSVEHPLTHVALVPARPLAGAEERSLRLDGVAAANLLRPVVEQNVAELGCDLDMAYAGLGLAV
jgi:hypothetical protein